MKKLSFSFLTILAVSFLASCGDDNSCSFEGTWKMKSADVKSEKLSPTILEMSKIQMMETEYAFTKDSITIINKSGNSSFAGTYSFDDAAQKLEWKTVSSDGRPYDESVKVTSCASAERTLIQRMPADTTKPEIAVTTMVLEKVK